MIIVLFVMVKIHLSGCCRFCIWIYELFILSCLSFYKGETTPRESWDAVTQLMQVFTNISYKNHWPIRQYYIHYIFKESCLELITSIVCDWSPLLFSDSLTAWSSICHQKTVDFSLTNLPRLLLADSMARNPTTSSLVTGTSAALLLLPFWLPACL